MPLLAAPIVCTIPLALFLVTFGAVVLVVVKGRDRSLRATGIDVGVGPNLLSVLLNGFRININFIPLGFVTIRGTIYAIRRDALTFLLCMALPSLLVSLVMAITACLLQSFATRKGLMEVRQPVLTAPMLPLGAILLRYCDHDTSNLDSLTNAWKISYLKPCTAIFIDRTDGQLHQLILPPQHQSAALLRRSFVLKPFLQLNVVHEKARASKFHRGDILWAMDGHAVLGPEEVVKFFGRTHRNPTMFSVLRNEGPRIRFLQVPSDGSDEGILSWNAMPSISTGEIFRGSWATLELMVRDSFRAWAGLADLPRKHDVTLAFAPATTFFLTAAVFAAYGSLLFAVSNAVRFKYGWILVPAIALVRPGYRWNSLLLFILLGLLARSTSGNYSTLLVAIAFGISNGNAVFPAIHAILTSYGSIYGGVTHWTF